MRPDVRTIRFKLRMTPVSKFVYNEYTGLEIQQTAKILWTPSNVIWYGVQYTIFQTTIFFVYKPAFTLPNYQKREIQLEFFYSHKKP